MTSISKEMMARMDFAFFLVKKVERLDFQILLGLSNVDKMRVLISDLYDPYIPKEDIIEELNNLRISPKLIAPDLPLDEIDYEGYFKQRLGRIN